MMARARAIGRSLRIYHAPGRAAALDAFYRRFVPAGGLAFDIGAHVGDRTACFRRLGARVVAVEPQPDCVRALRLLFGRDLGDGVLSPPSSPGLSRGPCAALTGVLGPRDKPGDDGVFATANHVPLTLVIALIGAREGAAPLWLNQRNPTISTASPAFIAATDGAGGWEGERWDTRLDRAMTTIDALAERHGRPDFIKLDVEGYEAEALAGLTFAPAALSFEFTTIQRDIAAACLQRLAALGYRAFNACLGEGMAFAHAAPIGADSIAAWIAALPHEANSGDVYAATDPGLLRAGG